MDLDKQLNLLESRKLIITNQDRAKRLIMTSSYYDLINGYKSVFMLSNDRFKDNVKLEDIYIFSFIDKGIQSITMKYSLMIETLFKTRLSYVISNHLGVHQDDYLHARYYKRQINHLSFAKVKQEINKQLDICNAKQPTKYYLKHHNHVPPWILFKNISFGSAINIFRLLSTKHKREVANLLLPTDLITCKDKIELLINTLEAIRRFRNCAAHSLNFFGCRSVYNIPGNILYTIVPNGVLKREKGEITSRDKKSLKGIYGVLIMTALLLNDKLLVSSLIAECRGVFKPEVSGDDDSKHIVDLINELKQKYKEDTQIPIDFIDRLEIIYKSIT